jgi:hypothetical protein
MMWQQHGLYQLILLPLELVRFAVSLIFFVSNSSIVVVGVLGVATSLGRV